MKPKAPPTPPLRALVDELIALDPGPRALGSQSLRARVVSRLYFAGFQVIEEIGSDGERTVPFVLGVKGRPRESERAVLIAATLRPGTRAAEKGSKPAADADVVTSPRLPSGVAGVACALAATGRLREAELNRPLLFLVAFEDVSPGSALLTLRSRYGLDVATALLVHPTNGGVALASPGLVAFDVALRRRVPEWRVGSLAHTVRVRVRGPKAPAALLASLATAVGSDGVVFEPLGEDAAGEGGAVLATPTPWSPPAGVRALASVPERLGYPFGPELVAAFDVWQHLSAAFPGLILSDLGADGETLRLTLRLLLPPSVALEAIDRDLEQAITGLTPSPDVELEITPRLHRPPFVAGPRVRALLAAKAPELAPGESSLPSEAGLAGTPEVLLLGPEAEGQGDTLAMEKVESVTGLMTRLLTRLMS